MDEEPAIGATTQERVDGSWLVLEYPDNPTIRFDARLLDRVLVDDDYIILAVDDVTPFLKIPDGPDAARDIAERLAPHTRSAPITRPEAFDDAKRRLDRANVQQNGRAEPALFFGNEGVYASDEILYIGDFACLISDVERYAEMGACLPLPNGALQAALAMLVVAVNRRKEDLTALALRIAEYEARLADP